MEQQRKGEDEKTRVRPSHRSLRPQSEISIQHLSKAFSHPKESHRVLSGQRAQGPARSHLGAFLLVRKGNVPLPMGYSSRMIQPWKLLAAILQLCKGKSPRMQAIPGPRKGREKLSPGPAALLTHTDPPSLCKPLRAKFSFPWK